MTKLSSWKKGFAALLLCAATAIAARAQTFNSLVSFDGPNGAFPYYGAMVQGRDGNLAGAELGVALSSKSRRKGY
jgi:hypothetical protein